MTKTLERFERLLALTTSANEQEARNAAVLACRMFSEGRLKAVLPDEAREATILPFVRPGSTDRQRTNTAPLNKTPVGSVEQMRIHLESILGKGHAAIPSPDKSAAEEPVYLTKIGHSGMCRDCDTAYHSGDKVWVRQGFGAVHHRCRKSRLT